MRTDFGKSLETLIAYKINSSFILRSNFQKEINSIETISIISDYKHPKTQFHIDRRRKIQIPAMILTK